MKKLLLLLTAGSIWISSIANNVVISNVSLVNGGPNNIYIQFDLTWENSWRVLSGPANYDGVWVFFKFKVPGGTWQHLYLNTNTSADLLPAGIDYWRPVTGVASGAVIHRAASNIGTGTTTATGIRLTVFNTVGYDIELRSFVIEMVFIPSPPSDVRFGDGNGTNESTNAFHPAGSDNNHTRNNLLSNVDPNAIDDSEIETPNDFVIGSPDGLNGLPINNNLYPTLSPVWCMKYELTQGAYRDFLNTLTFIQQATRTFNSPTAGTGTGALTTSGVSRNFIEIKTASLAGAPAVYGCDASGNNVHDEAADGEFVACNFLGWPDLAAWLDWAGMAPMTEIHFERICRGSNSAGPILPTFGEFAWGNTSIFATPHILAFQFTESEISSNASTTLGNTIHGTLGGGGPARNGIFATSTTNRTTSGASYYGVMEMSGNLTEGCVGVGNVAGRSFNKLGTSRGDGSLSTNGNANSPHWPGNIANASLETASSGEITTEHGTKRRGGDFTVFAGSGFLSISDRQDNSMSINRVNFHGGRGVIVLAMY